MDVSFIKLRRQDLDELPIVDGQIIFCKDADEVWYDMNLERHFATGVTLDTEQEITASKIFSSIITISALQTAQSTASNSSVAEGLLTSAQGDSCHSEGYQSKADSGFCCHAEGNETQASYAFSHAEGVGTIAASTGSHAEGNITYSSGMGAHAEGGGNNTLQLPYADGDLPAGTYSSLAVAYTGGTRPHVAVEGMQVQVGQYTQTIAYTLTIYPESTTYLPLSEPIVVDSTIQNAVVVLTVPGSAAIGTGSHAEGNSCASGTSSHAEGIDTHASAYGAHAEGYNTSATGFYAHAEGDNTQATGYVSHAEGSNTEAAAYGHAEGGYTKTSGLYAHAEGTNSAALGYASHAEGSSHLQYDALWYQDPSDNTSHVLPAGTYTELKVVNMTNRPISWRAGTVIAIKSHGGQTSTDYTGLNIQEDVVNAGQTKIISLGGSITISSPVSDAVVSLTFITGCASSSNSHAEGSGYANGDNSHAEGVCTYTGGVGSHSQGIHTVASGEGAFSSGIESKALGEGASAIGVGVTAGDQQTALGKYNSAMQANDVLAVGCGTSSEPITGLRVSILENEPATGTYEIHARYSGYAEQLYNWQSPLVTSSATLNRFLSIDDGEIIIATGSSIVIGVSIEKPGHVASSSFASSQSSPYVGLLGTMVVVDDGSCVAGNYCMCGTSGEATAVSGTPDQKWLVTSRIDSTHVEILFK